MHYWPLRHLGDVVAEPLPLAPCSNKVALAPSIQRIQPKTWGKHLVLLLQLPVKTACRILTKRSSTALRHFLQLST